MSYFDDPATVPANADKGIKEENSPTKKLHMEGNVKTENASGNPNQSASE